MWNMVAYFTGQARTSGAWPVLALTAPWRTSTGWRAYRARVMSASRWFLKMGAAPVLGLTRTKSAAPRLKSRPGASSSSRLCK